MFTDEQLVLAKCAEEDPELFFSDDATKSGRAKIEMAKAICSTCLVKDVCLKVAKAEQLTGVWGGLTFRERQGFHRSSSPKVLMPKTRKKFRASNAQRLKAAVDGSIGYLSLALSEMSDRLPAETIEMITIRVNNPGISLEEVGKRMTVPMTKHSVAGRLRRVVDSIKESENE